MVNRSSILVFALFVLLTGCQPLNKNQVFDQNWQRYKAKFLVDGRIIDTGNNNISHSEGQGYGMLFAMAADDRQSFDELWAWTVSTMQRSDYLFSWQFVPCEENSRSCIKDTNNATDGDILIAWALLRAAEKWREQKYADDARVIINEVASKLIKERYGYHLLLPGRSGFVHQDHIQINLSYWVYPALQNFYQISKDVVWLNVINSGYELTNKARYTAHKLPPDWISVFSKDLSFDNANTSEYGFNAVRIPLHIAWSYTDTQSYNLLIPFFDFWEQPFVPAVVNLKTSKNSKYSLTGGMKSVAFSVKQIVYASSYNFNRLDPNEDYYSASLTMLSQLALMDKQYFKF